MQEKYGLFKAMGRGDGYGKLGSQPLQMLLVDSRDTLNEMEEYIATNEHIPATTSYIVMKYWEYFKPMPTA